MTDDDKRDHRDEHEGCKVMWPWLKWCSRYRYSSDLVRMALKDIEGIEEEDLDRQFRMYKRGHEVWRLRSDARAKYIMYIEGWAERDIDSIIYMYENFGPNPRSFEGRTLEEEIAYQIHCKRQRHAIQLLYAYGMFNPRTGKIEPERIAKLDRSKKIV